MGETVIVKQLVIGAGRPKICVPVTARTRRELLENIKLIRQNKSMIQLLEWRVDWFDSCLNFQRVENALAELRSAFPNLPVIFTFRSREEGGKRQIYFRDYRNLYLRIAQKSLAEIIDVEIEKQGPTEQLIQELKKKNVTVIASNHHFEGTPSLQEMISVLEKMQRSGADIVKLAVMPNSKSDVMNLMQAALTVKEKKKTPVVAMAMGELGRVSRLSGGFFGSDLTFGMVGASSAPGQIEVSQLNEALHIFESNKKNIFLIGFMGSGKSKVSVGLSKLLRMEKLEMDECIEQQQNQKITEIFAEKGEEYFRNLETEFLRELTKKENQLVSCGGGVVLREENIELMKQSGKIVLLTATPGTIFERVRNSKDRPVLNGHMSIEYIRELMEKRMPYYRKAADYIVETDGKKAELICKEIQRIL